MFLVLVKPSKIQFPKGSNFVGYPFVLSGWGNVRPVSIVAGPQQPTSGSDTSLVQILTPGLRSPA